MSSGQTYGIKVVQTAADNTLGLGAGVGTLLSTIEMENLTIQLGPAAVTGTVQFQGTIDGVNWFSLGAALTAAGAFNVPFAKLFAIRAKTNADVGSGPAVATLACSMRGE